jgi:hypothetical protein
MRLDVARGIRSACAAGTALAASALLPVVAADQPAPAVDRYKVTLYAFLADIGGTTAFPAGSSSQIDISIEDILENLELAAMAAFEYHTGRWGGLADVIYLDVGASKTGTRSLEIGGGTELPGGITADLSLDAEAWVGTLAGVYRVVSTPRTRLDVLLGARLLDLSGTLDYAFNIPFGPFPGTQRTGTAKSGWDGWDGIAGAMGQVSFGARRAWFVRYYLDVGTGSSDLTYQGILGGGYAFSHVDLIVAYRHVGYEFDPDAKLEDLDFSGPALGVAFRW